MGNSAAPGKYNNSPSPRKSDPIARWNAIHEKRWFTDFHNEYMADKDGTPREHSAAPASQGIAETASETINRRPETAQQIQREVNEDYRATQKRKKKAKGKGKNSRGKGKCKTDFPSSLMKLQPKMECKTDPPSSLMTLQSKMEYKTESRYEEDISAGSPFAQHTSWPQGMLSPRAAKEIRAGPPPAEPTTDTSHRPMVQPNSPPPASDQVQDTLVARRRGRWCRRHYNKNPVESAGAQQIEQHGESKTGRGFQEPVSTSRQVLLNSVASAHILRAKLQCKHDGLANSESEGDFQMSFSRRNSRFSSFQPQSEPECLFDISNGDIVDIYDLEWKYLDETSLCGVYDLEWHSIDLSDASPNMVSEVYIGGDDDETPEHWDVFDMYDAHWWMYAKC